MNRGVYMKWSGKIGSFTARKCCFCEYWSGSRPEPVPNSNGMYQYDTHYRGVCRYPLFRGRSMTAGAVCGYFEEYIHLH